MDIEVRQPRTPQEFELYYDLRWRILREPWGQSRESAQDEHERDAVHVMAWSGSDLLGVGRIHCVEPGIGQIRFMAVERSFARRGVGSRILDRLESWAREAGLRRIVLNARDEAVPFYSRHGYQVVRASNRLFDAIVQWQMAKDLS